MDKSRQISLSAVFLVLITVSLVLVLYNQYQIMGIISTVQGVTGGAVMGGDTDEMVTVEFYVMSQCPYGVQVEKAIDPVLREIGDNVDYQVNYIATDLGDGTFRSLHGQPEVDGDIVQLCVNEHYPEKFVDFLACQNENAAAVNTNWESCSDRLGLDVDTVRTCFEGEEGAELFRASIQASNEVGARGSPTIYINGKPYQNQRTPDAFMSTICAEFQNPPSGCQGAALPSDAPAAQGNC